MVCNFPPSGGRTLKWLAVAAAAAVIAIVAAFARSEPYQEPRIDENGAEPASFDGLDALVSKEAPGRVLWVHGMCRHDDLWAEHRAKTLAVALGGAAYTQMPASLADGAAWTDDIEFTVPNKGRLDVTFFLWSRFIDKYRQQLAYDADVGATRATLNKDLKLALTDGCLVDAIIYSGRNGDSIRVAMRESVCQALGGTTGETGPCDLSGAPAPRRIAFVTESIGSKILFDALRDLWASAIPDTGRETPAMKGVTKSELARRSAQVSVIYMVANQLPLLDQANPVAPGSAPYESSIKAVGDLVAESRSRIGDWSGLPNLTIVAFSDPNDLLSFRLPPSLAAPAMTRLINITVSNAWTYFGWVERPLLAHCAYMQNPVVVHIIAHGYHGGRLQALTGLEPDSACAVGKF